MCITPCMVRLTISAAHSSSSRYSEVKGSAAKSGPDGASRRSAGNLSRSVGTLEPRPASGPSHPSSSHRGQYDRIAAVIEEEPKLIARRDIGIAEQLVGHLGPSRRTRRGAMNEHHRNHVRVVWVQHEEPVDVAATAESGKGKV